jgi:3-hydroxymyristoyl/3-hydroxydecanoyl-(acyl carrier protein) dehydratase
MSVNTKASLFDEHFVNNPILPGSFSLIAICSLIGNILKSSGYDKYRLARILKLDFVIAIQPGANLSLVSKILSSELNLLNINFNLKDKCGKVFVKGIVVFEVNL